MHIFDLRHCGQRTFEIASVVKNKQVTIKSYDFPPDTDFVVTMGSYGAKGIGGVAVTTIDSEDGGSFVATYSIPQTLRGLKQIAIRLQSPTGYYSYNWFYNNSTE